MRALVVAACTRALSFPTDACVARLLDVHDAYARVRTAPVPPSAAPTYGEAFLWSSRRWLRSLGVGPDSHVLDIGCGRGMVLLAARSLGARATGIEVDEGFSYGSDVVVGDAVHLEWPACTHIVCAWTLFDDAARRHLEQRFEQLRGVMVATTTFDQAQATVGITLATTHGWLSTSWRRY
jgi:SAM-dependent methyltransferase